jgi:biotin operon repressor
MSPKELSRMEMVQRLAEKPMSQKELAGELGLSERYVK